MDLGGEKIWKIHLLETDVFWQEMVRRQIHPELDSRTSVRRRIAAIKQKHQEYFNRRFIYFICTRARVRFVTDRQPRFPFFRNKLFVDVRIAGHPHATRCVIPSESLLRTNERGRRSLPVATTSDVALTLTYPGGYRETTSIHDFLLAYNLNLGIDTYVHYVGLTKNPDTRPLLDRHEGRQRVEGRAERENRDVLFFYNTFAVRHHAEDPQRHAVYWVSNSFTDNLDIQDEGLALEKLFVAYLQPDCQGSMKSEMGQLRRLVRTLESRHRVRRIDVEYEVDSTSEYYRFYSDTRPPSAELSFSVVTSGPLAP